jgi:probable phosphoglycerate mutase
LPINQIISSPLLRAHDTAKIILRELDIDQPITTDDRLKERDAGSITGRPRGSINYALMNMADHVSDAESTEQMYNRLRSFLDDVRRTNIGTTLIVAHNGVIKVSRTILAGRDWSEVWEMPNLDNGGLFHFDY